MHKHRKGRHGKKGLNAPEMHVNGPCLGTFLVMLDVIRHFMFDIDIALMMRMIMVPMSPKYSSAKEDTCFVSEQFLRVLYLRNLPIVSLYDNALGWFPDNQRSPEN